MAEVAFGPEIIREAVELTVVRAATQDAHIALLFRVQGVSPVYADVVFGRLLLGAPAPIGGRVKISVPLVASLPGASNVAVVKLSSTTGPVRSPRTPGFYWESTASSIRRASTSIVSANSVRASSAPSSPHPAT